jgi:lipoprotein-anchoring transpeptidase ErfK/SrfK/peptidoglycan hydrolase-like protein with peptidoglycan-binding domain
MGSFIRVERVRCGVYEYERGEARKFAQKAAAFAVWLGVAAVAVAVATAPAEAKQKRAPVEKPAEETISDPANGEPMTLVVSLKKQMVDVYRGTTLITSSKVSTGMPGHDTNAGVFSILEKQRYHHSNMYSAAPMPWMNRITWSGTALHGGVVPGYPASHGCIRLPFSFAPKLFEMTTIGDNVVIGHDEVVPKLIDHPNLFQPLPPPAPPLLANSAQAVPPQSNGMTEPPSVEGITAPDVTNEGGSADVSLVAERPEQATTESSGRVETAYQEGSGATLEASPHAADPSIDVPPLAPLRILVTRQTERDRIIGVQYMLSSMGYLPPQNFSGRLGEATVNAIKAFQKANDLRETGAFTDTLMKKVYEVAGKKEPAEGHLFVRQEFRPVFNVPIAIRNPEQPLGTYVFTAMKFAPGDTKTQWMGLNLEGDNAAAVLDRIQIPGDARQKISERLTPGSSLIIADQSVDAAILPDGGDFLVSVKETPTVAEKPGAKQANAKRSGAKQANAKNPKARQAKTQQAEQYWPRGAWNPSYDRPPNISRRGLFSRWFSRQ